MPFPQIRDNGQTVELDLHGARVEDAVALTRKLLDEATRRGRSSVRLIHGHSTSDGMNYTIKRALYDLLEESSVAAQFGSVVRSEGSLLISLPIVAGGDTRRISFLDLQ